MKSLELKNLYIMATSFSTFATVCHNFYFRRYIFTLRFRLRAVSLLLSQKSVLDERQSHERDIRAASAESASRE